MGFRSALTGLFSIWPAPCYLERICQTNSGQRQFLPPSISRTGFLTLVFVGISLLMRCGLESSRPCPIFAFSDVQPTLTFLKRVVRNMAMGRSTIAQSTHISLGMINRTPSTKFGIHQTIPLFALGMSFLMKLCIIRMRATSTSCLSLSNHLNTKIRRYLIFRQLLQLLRSQLNLLSIYPNLVLQRFHLRYQLAQLIGPFLLLRLSNQGILRLRQLKLRPLRKLCHPIPS